MTGGTSSRSGSETGPERFMPQRVLVPIVGSARSISVGLLGSAASTRRTCAAPQGSSRRSGAAQNLRTPPGTEGPLALSEWLRDPRRLAVVRHWRIVDHALRRDADLHESDRAAGRRRGLSSLQIALMLRPEQGPVIRGGGGSARCAGRGQGEGRAGLADDLLLGASRGGVLHALRVCQERAGRSDAAQARALGQLVREEFK